MVSRREKGNISERKTVELLEGEGWLVYRVPGSVRFNRKVDMFYLFDIIALKGKMKRWIQVKTNRKVYGKQLEPFREFAKDYTCKYDSVEIWSWFKRQKEPVIIIVGDR